MATTELSAARAAGAGGSQPLLATGRRLRDEINRLHQVVRDHDPQARRRELAASIVAGGPIPEDLGADLVGEQTGVAKEAYEAAAFLQGVEVTVKARIESVQATGADLGLTHLHGRVQEIQSQAADLVAKLGAARTAEGVLNAGPAAASAWRDLDQLADVYAEVRQAQAVLTREAWPFVDNTGSPEVPLVQCGIVRDVPGLWPGYAESGRGWGAAPPWPHEDITAPYRVAHDRAYLIWAVEAGAQLWVPTASELLQADQQQEARKSAAIMATRGGERPPTPFPGFNDGFVETAVHIHDAKAAS